MEASSSSFSHEHYFRPRRRVVQACVNCRTRKSRCDAAKPKCSLCQRHNVECVYRDSQQPHIEHNTRILLERIQLLEDRLLSSSAFGPRHAGDPSGPSASTPIEEQPFRQTEPPKENFDGDLDMQIALSHTANANHVYEWPIVRQLLGEDLPALAGPTSTSRRFDATDVFFESISTASASLPPPETWRLFRDNILPTPSEAITVYRHLIDIYFAEVNIFFPLFSREDLLGILDEIAACELSENPEDRTIPQSRYGLLLLVLCFGSFVASGKHLIRLDEATSPSVPRFNVGENLDGHLWRKAKLILGWIASELTLEAAQCITLAGLYTGASGSIADSFHWAHAAAVKCEALARRDLAKKEPEGHFSDSFRRLYWVALIYESDFMSEISITLPSGIARYESIVPYPVFETPDPGSSEDAVAGRASSIPPVHRVENFVAFQISTNAAIRRFLNRVNNVVYDAKRQYRMTQPDYATWLLRVEEDLWSHQSALYRNLPDFLLKSQSTEENRTPSTVGTTEFEEMGNNPWNILRLKGRYYAGQYIIHRPFVEYVLLNLEHFDTHPCMVAVLENCRMCFQGCQGFIGTFDFDPANSITCLFASGMVIFTMVIILRVATACPIFRGILPDEVEEVICLGKRNLQRFQKSIKEFEWHLQVLERLDSATGSIIVA